MAVIVSTHTTVPRRDTGVRLDDAQRSLSVSARLALCLQPEFDQVSISVVGPAGHLSTWAQAGELAGAFDRLQFDLGEGPCIDSIHEGRSIEVPHLPREARWRRYVAAAAQLGVRSQVSAPLQWRDDAPLGALNMYSTTQAEVCITAHLVAEVLAAQVAGALAGLRETDALHDALAASRSIGQATGLVMARLEVDADHASAYLRRVSMLRDQKLAEVADDLVRTRRLPRLPPD